MKTKKINLGRVGLVPKGAYSPDATYGRMHLVTYKNTTYWSKQEGNTGHEPLGEDDWWGIIVDGQAAYAGAFEAMRATERANTAAKEAERTNSAVWGAEQMRESAETERNQAEEQRKAQAQSMADAEQSRAEAEQGRVEAESQRVKAEERRASEETLRAAAEETRKSDEADRIAGETSREQQEESRESAEQTRDADEAQRKIDETKRASAETKRADAEDARKEAETGRVSAETDRAAAETKRAKAETARADAETKRAAAETKREEDFSAKVEEVDTAVTNAQTATSEAEKVDATITDANVLEVTGRDGVKKSLGLVGQAEAASIKAAVDEVVPKVSELEYNVNGVQIADGIRTASIGYHTGNSTKDGNHFTASDKENVSADYALKGGHKYLIAYKGNSQGYLTIKSFTNSGPQPTTIDTKYMRGEYIYKFFSATQTQDGQFVGLAVVSTNNTDNNYYLYVFDVTDLKATEEEILAVAKDNVESGILSFDGKVDKAIKTVAKNTEDITAINKTLTDTDLQYISKKAKLSPSYGTINVVNCVKAKGNVSIDESGVLNVVGNDYAADGVEVKFGKKYLCYVEYLLDVYYTLRIFNNSSYDFIENIKYHKAGETNLFVFTAPNKGSEVMQVTGTTSFPQSPVKIVMLDLDGISESEIELLKTLDYSTLFGKANADCPIDNLTPLVNKAIYGKFYDYPLSVIGDSLSTRLEFLDFLKEKLHIIDAGSSVMGGTRISGDDSNAYWQDKRVNAISADAKLVIIYGGMNDAGSFTVGDMNIGNFDTNTVVGAMNVLLSKLYYRYTKPSKGYYQDNGVDYSGVQQIENPLNKLNIVIITPPQRPLLGGYEKMAELAPKITEIARMWSIPCANGYAEMQYNTMLFDGPDVHYAMNWDDNLAGILKEKLMALEPIIDNQHYKTNKNTITVANSTSYSVSIAASAYEADYVNFHINTSASPTIVVKDADGKTIQLTNLGLYGDKSYHYYSFIMPASEVTITVS